MANEAASVQGISSAVQHENGFAQIEGADGNEQNMDMTDAGGVNETM